MKLLSPTPLRPIKPLPKFRRPWIEFTQQEINQYLIFDRKLSSFSALSLSLSVSYELINCTLQHGFYGCFNFNPIVQVVKHPCSVLISTSRPGRSKRYDITLIYDI